MARIDTNRGLAIPYRVGNPGGPNATVEEGLRAVWEELTRVAVSLSQLDQPTSVGAQSAESVPVGTTKNWSRLFNDGFEYPLWENPQTSFDEATGVYTVPQEGVYSIQVVLEFAAFTTPATKNYYGGIRGTVVFADGSGSLVTEAYNGGADTIPVNVTLLRTNRLTKGDTITFDGTAIHETKTGTTQCRGSLQIIRLSSSGNNTQ
jgi:hypothetical protein